MTLIRGPVGPIAILLLVALIQSLSSGCFSARTPVQKLARQYQFGKRTEDTSFAYQLPFTAGARSRIFQGYYSRFTHRYRAALDFRMKPGTEIRAAREGVVIRIKEDSEKGGWNKKYRGDANFIIIEHEDSTRAAYRHLKYQGVIVEPGDTVQTGELIGYSGKTGYTASPHLHFMVSAYLENQWQQIPTRFITDKRTGYLRPLKKYKSVNEFHSVTSVH